jgi:hypothetical protein
MNPIAVIITNGRGKAQGECGVMHGQSELMPVDTTATPGRWSSRLFRLAYLGAVAVAMIGWLIVLAWGSFLLLRHFL